MTTHFRINKQVAIFPKKKRSALISQLGPTDQSNLILSCLVPVVTLLFILLAQSVNAQQLIIDSLEARLNMTGQLNAHQRTLTLIRLSSALATDSPEKAQILNEQGLALARKTNDRPAISFAFAHKVALDVKTARADRAGQDADSAIYYSQGAAALIQGIAWFYKGFIQNIQNQPDQARKSWEKSLSFLKGNKGALYRANIYYLIYGIYAERNDNNKAALYAKNALQDALISGDAGMTTAAWQINGTLYLDQFNRNKDSLVLDSAVMAFKNAVSLYQQQSLRIKNPSVVVLPALNLADIYMDHYPPWYKDSILQYVNLSLAVSRQTGNLTMQANCYDVISRLALREGDFNGAEQALLKEKVLTDSMQPPNFYQSMTLYQSLATIKEKQGNLQAALGYYKQFMAFYKKEFNQQQYQTIQQLEAKYQDEKKNKAMQLLVQESKFQKRQFYLYIGLAILAIIGLLLLFLAYKFRLKYSLERERLKEEEAARLKAEQKLIERQKEQLQKEVLAGTIQVEHKNELLQNLKEKLTAHTDVVSHPAARQLEKIIHEELLMDENFDEYRTAFKDIHPDFFSWLESSAASNGAQKLTALDLKYAAYIYMKLNSKQIAGLLHVAPKSVRMAKYRLKQKLGFGKEDDLESCIANWQKPGY